MKFVNRYFYTCLLSLSLFFDLRSQGSDVFYSGFKINEGQRSHVDVYSQYSVGSNAITNDFSKILFYTGGYIDQAMKNKISKKLKDSNRFGGDITAGFVYSKDLPKKNRSISFIVEHKKYLNASFSDDFFSIAMNGNKQFAGTTADLSGFSLNSLQYQKVGVGLMWTNIDSVAKLGIGFAYLNGVKNIAVEAKNAELYTSPDGRYIDLMTSISYDQSDTGNLTFFKNNGYGFSTDLYFEAPYKLKNAKGKVVINVDDVGFIRWNNNSLSYNKQDASYHFDGVTVNNIFEINDSAFGETSRDSLLRKIIPAGKHSYTTVLPATLDIYTNTIYNDRFQFIKGIRYIFNANNKALFYLGANYFPNKKLMLTTNLSYGGYTGIGVGLGLTASLLERSVLRIYSNNVEGYIMPRKTTAQGLYVSLKQYF